MPNVKTYAEWKGDLKDYLAVGDLVDEEMMDHFLNVLPPACWTHDIIQIGEPANHIGTRATYPTLKRTADGWTYAGNCFQGCGEQPSLTVRFSHEDHWGRKIYEAVETSRNFALVDGSYHVMTDDGEPVYPISRDINVIIES